MRQSLPKLRDECRAAGRDYNKLDITVMGTVKGQRGEVQDELRRFEDCGVGRYVLTIAALTPEDYKERLELYGSLYL
jgi:hypothetical protein